VSSPCECDMFEPSIMKCPGVAHSLVLGAHHVPFGASVVSAIFLWEVKKCFRTGRHILSVYRHSGWVDWGYFRRLQCDLTALCARLSNSCQPLSVRLFVVGCCALLTAHLGGHNHKLLHHMLGLRAAGNVWSWQYLLTVTAGTGTGSEFSTAPGPPVWFRVPAYARVLSSI
jgi:hypothetical protein